jgi:hypothetical protein
LIFIGTAVFPYPARIWQRDYESDRLLMASVTVSGPYLFRQICPKKYATKQGQLMYNDPEDWEVILPCDYAFQFTNELTILPRV